MKNVDKVRAMDIDELAFILMCPYDGTEKKNDDFCKGGHCVSCVRLWLESEAEE